MITMRFYVLYRLKISDMISSSVELNGAHISQQDNIIIMSFYHRDGGGNHRGEIRVKNDYTKYKT